MTSPASMTLWAGTGRRRGDQTLECLPFITKTDNPSTAISGNDDWRFAGTFREL
jgi:hypothetical protein